jgi:hypothetical protein
LHIPFAALQSFVFIFFCSFFNIYFVSESWNSVFHLFQSAGLAFNCTFKIWLKEPFISRVSVWFFFFLWYFPYFC